MILVVGGLLFPLFAQPRGGRRQICLSNAKHLGTAMVMYLQDNDGVFPSENVAQTPGQDWDDLLLPYIKNEWVFRCPNAETPEQKDAVPARVRHYAVNANLYRRRLMDSEKPAKSAPRSTAGISFPETTVALCEVRYWVRGSDYRVPQAAIGPDRGIAGAREGWEPLGKPGAVRHAGRSCYVFADGHGKMLPPEAVRGGSATGDGKQRGFGL